MRVLVFIVLVAILGFFFFKKDDAGELCLSMSVYEPEEFISCLWPNIGDNDGL